jgi:hypothetical protein
MYSYGEDGSSPCSTDLGGEPTVGSSRRLVAGAELSPALWTALCALPDRPGVYRLIGHDGAVVYVGKARSLLCRVSSYFAPSPDGRRLAQAIRRATAAVEIVETGSELGALLEELRQIRAYRPRFNVQRLVHRRRPPKGRFVLFLPGQSERTVELMGVCDGIVVGSALVHARRRPLRPVWALLRRCLSFQTATRPANDEDQLVASWLRCEQARCNLIDLAQTGGIRDAARLVRAYLADPALLTGKIYLR